MALDMFLDLDGVEGDSNDARYRNTIVVLSWSWGASNPAGFGKVSVQDLTITKYVDASSTELLKACASQNEIAKGSLILRKTDKNPIEFLVFTFESILVTSVLLAASDEEYPLKEHISLNCGKVKMEYKPRNDAGAEGPIRTFYWDIGAATSEPDTVD